MLYGGYAFFAPLDISSNTSLGARKKDEMVYLEDMEFIDYVWSSSTQGLVEEMKAFNITAPKLKNSPHFRKCLLSKRVLTYTNDMVLPKNHFPIENALIIPVVINRQSVALLGLANGSYEPLDSEILFELLPKMWTDVILESVAKANKKLEDTQRLKLIEKRVESGKKLLTKLTSALNSSNDTNSVEMTKAQFLRKKLTDLGNFMEATYGGICFVAPLRVEVNVSFMKIDGTSSDEGTSDEEVQQTTTKDDKKINARRFMAVVFSDSTKQIRNTVMKKFSPPRDINTSSIFAQVCTDKKPIYIADPSKLKLPVGHFRLTSVLAVPVVVNLETCAIVVCGNGKYSEFDGYVLYDALSTAWFSILSECFSRMDLKVREKSLKSQVGGFTLPQQNKRNSVIDIAMKLQMATIVIVKIDSIKDLYSKMEPTIFFEFISPLMQKLQMMMSKLGIQKIEINSGTLIGVLGLNDSPVDKQVEAASRFAATVNALIYIVNTSEDIPSEVSPYLPMTLKTAIALGGPLIVGMIGSEKFKYDMWGSIYEQAKLMINFCEPTQTILNANASQKLPEGYSSKLIKEVSFASLKTKDTIYQMKFPVKHTPGSGKKNSFPVETLVAKVQ